MTYRTAEDLHGSFARSFRRLAEVTRELGGELDSPSVDGFLRRIRLGERSIIFSAEAMPLNNAASEFLAKDKLSSYQILEEAHVPVPKGLVFFRREYRGAQTGMPAWSLLDALPERVAEVFPCWGEPGERLVVKPGRESHGLGVSICTTLQEVLAAAEGALSYGRYGLIQEFIQGDEYRVALLDDEMLIAYQKRNPALVGDGATTLEELVLRFNRQVAPRPESPPVLDPKHLPPSRTGRPLSPSHVLAPGEVLELDFETYNLSRGARAELVEQVPPEVLTAARNATKALGLRYSGSDVRFEKAAHGARGVVIEVNGNPGFDFLASTYPQAVKNLTRTILEKVMCELK